MSPDRRRLLFLSPIPPPTGGIGTWTRAVLGSSLRERFDMQVVSTSPSDKINVQGRSRLRFDRVVDAVRILGTFGWQLMRARPDALHVNTSYHWAFLRDALAVWLASAFEVRTVLHFRGGDFPEFVASLRPMPRRLIEATLRRTDRLVALEAHTRRYLEAIVDPERVRCIPNFVRLEEFGTPPDRRDRPAPLRVLFVGWILEAKGIRELLAAARELPDLHFTLVGPQEPEFAASMRPQIEAFGPRVRVLPPMPREGVVALYREADIFVLPTHREGFPNVVLEAMAAGLPIVATTVGAIPAAVGDEREGLLVPPRDAGALAAGLRRLAGDPALRLRMGEAARKRVESAFSFEAVLRQLATLYDELLA